MVAGEVGGLAMVVLKRAAGAVKRVAVDLEHDVVVGPVEVDLVAVHADVDLRGGQAGLADQLERTFLGLRPRQGMGMFGT